MPIAGGVLLLIWSVMNCRGIVLGVNPFSAAFFIHLTVQNSSGEDIWVMPIAHLNGMPRSGPLQLVEYEYPFPVRFLPLRPMAIPTGGRISPKYSWDDVDEILLLVRTGAGRIYAFCPSDQKDMIFVISSLTDESLCPPSIASCFEGGSISSDVFRQELSMLATQPVSKPSLTPTTSAVH
jgi:hypothetical protein